MPALDIHPFERAGLGVAPYTFLGVSERVYVACPGAPAQPGGTCDYCGNGIRYLYHCVSADGRRFAGGARGACRRLGGAAGNSALECSATGAGQAGGRG